jgi:hypothetical protein
MLELSMNRIKFSLERFSLTPALSRWERENYSPMVGDGRRLHRFMVPMHSKKSKGGSP